MVANKTFTLDFRSSSSLNGHREAMDAGFEDDPGALSDREHVDLAAGELPSDAEDGDEDLVMDGMGNKIWLAKVRDISLVLGHLGDGAQVPKYLAERWGNVKDQNAELGRLRVWKE
jgi:hypothetical protein